MTTAHIDTVIFDLGNVLIEWNPRHLFRKLFGADVAGMEHFLSVVCNTEWNEQQDRGRPWKDAIAEAIARHPAHASNICAYFDRWPEMIPGALQESVAVLKQLQQMNVRLLALTNWSDETFHFAQDRFDFLNCFEGIVVSGRERLVKPQPEIFQLTIDRFQLRPASTVFIDDSLPNVEAAARAGMYAIHFRGAEDVRTQLAKLGLVLPVGELQ